MQHRRDPLRVLVIGVGSIGERHVRCFLNSGRADVSICEVNDRLRHQIAGRYAVRSHFSDLATALAERHDAAVIAVPADAHIAIAHRAVDAGLHVLIEKPLAVTTDGVEGLSKAITRANRVAAVGYVFRAHPALSEMRSTLKAGSLGEPVQVTVVAGQNFPTYRPAYRNTYYASRATGGGIIHDAMTHLVNAVEWLVGPTDRVVADADHKLIPGVEVEDVVHFIARHGNVLGSYSQNQFQAPNEATITIVCERGTARFEYHEHRWRCMKIPDGGWSDRPAIGLDRDMLFVRQAESFLDAIESGASPLCTLDEGLQTLRVNLAIIRSVETNRWQAVLKGARRKSDESDH